MSQTDSAKHPLVGLWFHTWKDGVVEYQGQVLGIDGDFVLCQLYGWLDGCETNIEVMEKPMFYSDRVTLYASSEQMTEKYDRCQYDTRKKNGELIQR